ncbi:MAG TPA: radical SAM protein [Methanoregulaceae archaeon]|nr:radical SAM protein [Methanoregulaceae archaeon]
MRWKDLKADLLSRGSVRLCGEPAGEYIATSTAGPGAGTAGAIFFARNTQRVRLAVDNDSGLILTHLGGGKAEIVVKGEIVRGRLEPVALHCPRQAYITVTSGCIYNCLYCRVPAIAGRRKSIEEIESMVATVRDSIDAISITSGVLYSPEEEQEYVESVVERITRTGIPVGVSIYPTEESPERLAALGVKEVKFNLEAATEGLFAKMCPGLDYSLIWNVLERSVQLFGKGHVFSNVLIGLGETDGEMEACIRRLTRMGVIPILRPLNPAADLSDRERPSQERLLRLYDVHCRALKEAGLDPTQALSMCVACSGCDLVPGRDE